MTMTPFESGLHGKSRICPRLNQFFWFRPKKIRLSAAIIISMQLAIEETTN